MIGSVRVQEPVAAVSVCPCCAAPEIVGAEELVGTAAVRAVAEPAITRARASTAPGMRRASEKARVRVELLASSMSDHSNLVERRRTTIPLSRASQVHHLQAENTHLPPGSIEE